MITESKREEQMKANEQRAVALPPSCSATPEGWWARRAGELALQMQRGGVGELRITRLPNGKYKFEITPEERPNSLLGLAGLAMLHPAQVHGKNETVAGGICDFCGEDAPSLKVFNRAPLAGACYCRKCAPLSDTDADWPNAKGMAVGRERHAAEAKDSTPT